MWGFDVSYSAYVVLWIALFVIFPVALIVAGFRSLLAWRERRDGIEKPKRVQPRD